MKKQLFFVTITLISVLFSSCKTAMQIEKPKESYLPSNIAPAVSEIPLQVELDVKKLEAAVNKKMTGLLYEGSNISDNDLSIKVWKAQNFTFDIQNNVIEYRVPVKVWSRFAWKVQKFGLSVGDKYEATGSIALKYKTTIGIDKNWKIVSNTTASGYEWIEAPHLNIVGVNIPVKPIANLALSQCEKLISDEIDKSLAQSVNLKKYVNMAWTEAQKPIQVNKENDMWLRITPKDIYMSPLSSSNNKLNMLVAMYAQIESFMGAKPTANTAVTLPAFRYVNRSGKQFNLNVGVDVTFDKIAELAKKQLVGKKFTQGKKSITITDLSVFGSEGKAVFVADVTGSLKGRIYFSGKMAYNHEKVALEIIEPEFDVKTSNALVKSANWLLHGMILKTLTPYLTYPVQKDIDDMKAQANQTLNNYTIMDGISLHGLLNDVSVTSLDLVPGAVRIQANMKGNIDLKVEDLKF